jgi:hypothetical protein
MKKLFISLIAAGSFLLMNSCSEDYLDVNKNPNEAYNNQLTPKERLAAAETNIFATQSVTLNRFGNLMMNAWVGNIYQYTAPFDDEMKMNVTSTFYNNIWDNYYGGIMNFQTIIDSDNSSKRYSGHIAAAKVLKAYYMQTLVDLYNDVPYSEAFKGQANLTPKYDKGKDVYKNLIKEVDEAIALLNAFPATATYFNATGTTAGTSSYEDVIFNTNIASWKQLANTVKLKLIVRLSNCTDPEVIAYRDAALATLPSNAASYISTDVLLNPGYTAANTAQQNPLYRNYGAVTLNGEINSGYRLVLGSAHIIDNMLGRATRTSGLIDARVQRMFYANVWNALEDAEITPGFTGYFGLEQGTTNNSNTVGDYVGLGTKQFLITNATTGSTQAGVVMLNAEAQFLLAEAAVLFPSKFSGAQTFFNNGITASFTYLGLTAANAATYINNSNSRPDVGWTASTNKIAAIQYQKWIALTNINPTETFISYNKTGFPVTPMPINTAATSRPNRLIYPQSEYVANSANVPNMVKSDAFAINQFTPFWMK